MRCVALLSGGLDSQLAIRIMQEQGIEVEAVNFKTLFSCCHDRSAHIAHALGVRLTILQQEDNFLEVIRNPRFGYGRGANPCVDCRIYMFQRAHTFMQQIGAQFVVSGEVIGQRPMSQKRSDLDTIAHQSNLKELLLRPLSAKLLPVTRPELEGWVDREKLHGIYGRGRRTLIELGRRLGLTDIPSPSTGCALTERQFAPKVFDLIAHRPSGSMWDFELLKHGRHFRFSDRCKVVVGRRETENEHLEYLHQLPDASSTALLAPVGFPGPMALIVGPATGNVLEFACGLIHRFSKTRSMDMPPIRVTIGDTTRHLEARTHPEAERAVTLTTPRKA